MLNVRRSKSFYKMTTSQLKHNNISLKEGICHAR